MKYVPLKNLCIANHTIIKKIFAMKDSKGNYSKEINQPLWFKVNGQKVYVQKKVGRKKQISAHQVNYIFKLRAVEDPLLNLSDAERESIKELPNFFDRLIFSALTSLYHEGTKEISAAALYRIITGKTNPNCRPTPKHASEILASVKKLACLQISFDASDAFKSYTYKDGTPKYNNGKPLIVKDEPLISCSIFKGTFQSKKNTDIIRLNAESPLFKLSRLMNQLLTAPIEMLNVGTRHTINIYNVKFCTLIRTLENKKSKHLEKTVTFENVFEKCKIEKSKKDVLQKARDIAWAVTLNLQNGGILKNFKIVRAGIEYTKILLTYQTNAKKLSKKLAEKRRS